MILTRDVQSLRGKLGGFPGQHYTGITRSPFTSNSTVQTVYAYRRIVHAHGNRDGGSHNTYLHGFWLLCDLLEMLNLINIGALLSGRIDPRPESMRRPITIRCQD
jgi:hypothetical protein